jgi:hypothetical protein
MICVGYTLATCNSALCRLFFDSLPSDSSFAGNPSVSTDGFLANESTVRGSNWSSARRHGRSNDSTRQCRGELYPCETEVRLCDELETDEEVEVDMESDMLTVLRTGKQYPLKPIGDVSPHRKHPYPKDLLSCMTAIHRRGVSMFTFYFSARVLQCIVQALLREFLTSEPSLLLGSICASDCRPCS